MMVKEAALNLDLDLGSLRFRAGSDQRTPVEFSNFIAQGMLYYHYSQAIWQKVQAFGLQGEYRAEDAELKTVVQKTATISFVPPSFVRVAWQGLQLQWKRQRKITLMTSSRTSIAHESMANSNSSNGISY